MRSLGALRALARVELRESRRHLGRSWLVVLLIAVPVAAMVGASTLFQITQRTPDEQRAHVMGRSALRIDLSSGDDSGRVRELLAPHARIESVSFGREEVRVPGRALAARSLTVDAAALDGAGLAAGMLRVSAGRAPTGPHEVALSPVLMEGLGLAIGEAVTLASGSANVTGVVLDPENLRLPLVLHAPAPGSPLGARAWLVDLPAPDLEPATARLRSAGHRVTLRSELGERDDFEALAVFVIGGFGFFEAALVIAAAFAVSLRRRQREIGLLGATGASIGDIRASLFVSAILFASLGALIGVAVGIGAAAALHPFLDGWNHRWNGELELSPAHVSGAVALGLVAAVAAAALPARSATRLPIRVALSGRRPVTESSARWLALGVVLVAGGFGSMLWGTRNSGAAAGVGILGGSILGVLGLGACSPWLLAALARRAAPLPLAWRLAVRDAGRFRARNGPVVTAVLAGISVSVMLAALIESVESMLSVAPPALRDDQLIVDGPGAEEVARRLAEKFACVAIAPLAAAYSDGELVHARVSGGEALRREEDWVAVGDEELLRALDAQAASGSLRAGRALASSERSSASTEATELELLVGERVSSRIATVSFVPSQRVRAPLFVVGVEGLAALGLETGPPPNASFIPWLVRLDSAVTADVLERAQGVAADVAGSSVGAAILHLEPASIFIRLVLVLCFVAGLVVVFVATALSSVESAADARVLHTVGAAPGLLRSHVAARAGYLALLGCVLAVPAGLLPSYGLLALANVALEFAMPWPQLLIVCIGLPSLAFVGAWSFTALHPAASRARPALS